MFSDILLTTDFDRTLTGKDSTIPRRNIEAIEYFIAHGGTFTVNTGRSYVSFRQYEALLPTNAPLLLYNGSASFEKGAPNQLLPIPLEPWPVLDQVHAAFPQLNLEVQGLNTHYLIDTTKEFVDFYKTLGWDHTLAEHGQELGPFVKFSLFGQPEESTVANMYEASEEDLALFDAAERYILENWGDSVSLFRAAPRIIDVHAPNVSKLNAALALQKKLGKRILVCVGDGENDLPMLCGADFAFCPGDAIVADRFANVCPCDEGAVADVIYKKLPEIVKNTP